MAARFPILSGAVILLSPGICLAHSGVIVRDGFAISDVALFACAATGIWLAQRSMRGRARRRAATRRED